MYTKLAFFEKILTIFQRKTWTYNFFPKRLSSISLKSVVLNPFTWFTDKRTLFKYWGETDVESASKQSHTSELSRQAPDASNMQMNSHFITACCSSYYIALNLSRTFNLFRDHFSHTRWNELLFCKTTLRFLQARISTLNLRNSCNRGDKLSENIHFLREHPFVAAIDSLTT